MLSVDTDFPGGNALVSKIDGDRIHLIPDNRDSTRDWFYWSIRLKNCAHRRVTLVFDRHCTMTVRGAALSTDEGKIWSWVPEYTPYAQEVTFDCGPQNTCRVALAPPYTLANWQNFLEHIPSSAPFEQKVLCQTRQGRPVPCADLGAPAEQAEKQIVLTARHHACEMMASYLLEGLLQFFLERPALWETYRLLVFPFVDLDGVENGDQGKARAPHDHNRDYDEPGLYPETKAIRKKVLEETNDRLTATLDLHCPFVVGEKNNQKIYLVGSPQPDNWERQKAFSQKLASLNQSPLPFDANDSLPFGTDWNTNENYQEGRTFIQWMLSVRPKALASTFEFPYGDVKGHPVTPANARTFGHQVAAALTTP